MIRTSIWCAADSNPHGLISARRPVQALVALACLALSAAAAAEYELRLVTYDNPDVLVDVPVKEQNSAWWGEAAGHAAIVISHNNLFEVTPAGTKPYVHPYACWGFNILLDNKPLFEMREGEDFIALLPIARPKLAPGKHVIWPGNHEFTIGADGGVQTADPELLVGTRTDKGVTYQVIRIKSYPVHLATTNADLRAPKPASIVDEIALPDLTLRDCADDEQAAAALAQKRELKPRELLPSVRRFRKLTAWLPANTQGKGYVIYPLRQTFHLTANGIVLGAGGGYNVPTWIVDRFTISIPITRFPVEGKPGNEVIFKGYQKVTGFDEKKNILVLHAELHSREEPYEVQVGAFGPSMTIGGDLSKLRYKRLKVEPSPANPLFQRGLVVETDERHLTIGRRGRVRVQAVDPSEADAAGQAALDAAQAVEDAPKKRAAAQSALDAKKNELEKLKKEGKEIQKAEEELQKAQAALAEAEAGEKAAAQRKTLADETAAAVGPKDLLADAAPFVRLQPYGSNRRIDVQVQADEKDSHSLTFAVPEVADGVYKLQAGVCGRADGTQPVQREFCVDQWVTVTAGLANGVGIITQRGRTAFYRGESFWLCIAVVAAARPVPAGSPVAIELTDDAGARITLYNQPTDREIRERDTVIVTLGPETSAGLAPGRYTVQASVAGRASPPKSIYIVDPAPATHFTNCILAGKYDGYSKLYGSAISVGGQFTDDFARGLAESGCNAFKGMTYGMDRANFTGGGLLRDLVRERPELGPWEAYEPPSGRDQFMDALVRYNVRFYESLFTQRDSIMPRGDKMLDACERYVSLETESMRHSPAFRGVCLYDELDQTFDRGSTAQPMLMYFHRSDEMNYRRKYGTTSSQALRARDRFISRPEGVRQYQDAEEYRTWPLHLDDQWGEFTERMSRAAKQVMPEAQDFTLARTSALPGSTLGNEQACRGLDVIAPVGYKDKGGFGEFPVAGPLCADAYRFRRNLLVWPMLTGSGTGPYSSSDLRSAFFTLSQRPQGLMFMQFETGIKPSFGDNFSGLHDVAGTLGTRYGDFLLALERGYKKVAIYYSREMDVVSDTQLQCEGLWAACIRAGFPADFLTDTQLRNDEGLDYSVIFVPGFTYKEAVPPATLAALKRLKAAGKIIAVEERSRLDIEGIERVEGDFLEISDRLGGSFPKYLDFDDECWWNMTVDTTRIVRAFLSKHISPAAEHDLLVGPDWLCSGRGQYLIIPNLAETGFRGNHKTLYQAPDRPTLRVPADRFAGTPPVCYDLLEMQRLDTPPADGGKALQVQVDFRHYPGKILAFLPAAIDSLVLRAPQSVQAGSVVSYEAFVADAAGAAIEAAAPLEIAITAPSGKTLQRIYRASAPLCREAYHVPANIGGGTLRISVRELISGCKAEAAIEVAKGTLPPVQRDQDPVRLYDAERLKEFMTQSVAVARTLFAPGDLLQPTRLAIRIRDGEGPFCEHLRTRLSPETMRLMKDCKEGEDAPANELAALRDALLAELNMIVTGERLYTDERFPLRSLSVEAGHIGPLVTAKDELPDMNRLLLEETFSAEIVRRPPLFIAVEEGWVRPEAERLAAVLHAKGCRVRVTEIGYFMYKPSNLVQKAGETFVPDGTRLWRNEPVTPAIFLDAPLILLGSRNTMVNHLIERDLLPEPFSENFPGPGRAVLSWVRRAFSNSFDTVTVLANDAASLRKGIDALNAAGQAAIAGRQVHPPVRIPAFDEKAPLAARSGKERETTGFRDALSFEDEVETVDIDPATGRILVGTFGFGHNLFCFSADGKLLWKTFLPEHDVYLATWYDGGKRVLAATGQGFFIFLIDGADGTVTRKFASTEWPDFQVEEREYRTRVSVMLNPALNQILILGRTGVLAVDYDGNKMWFFDRAPSYVEYPAEAEQVAYAEFGGFLQMQGAALSPDGSKVAYTERRYFASTYDPAAMGQKDKTLREIIPLWRNEPWILDAKTGKLLLHCVADPGSNDSWGISWPQDSPNPWIHARNLSAPLLFAGDTPGADGKPDAGKLGAFVLPKPPSLKTGGRVEREALSLKRYNELEQLMWEMHDRTFWIVEADTLNQPNTRLYRCSRDGLVRCVDLANGSTVWEHKLPFNARLTVTPDDHLVAGGREGTIAKFGPAGQLLWKTRLRDHHEVPDRGYAGYVARAVDRDTDTTPLMYPVQADAPDDYAKTLHMGIDQLDNGGFESADGWTAAGGTVTLDTTAKAGKQSLLLKDAQRVTCTINRRIVPSATYLLEFFYQTDSADARVAAGARLGNDEGAGTLTLSNFRAKPGEWTFGRLAIKTHADTASMDLGFEAGGGARIDDVQLRVVRFPSANLLANPDLHKVEPTHPEDFRVTYNKVPNSLRWKMLYESSVATFLQSAPVGAMVFTEEQAFLQNGRLDDIGTMWCYRPERIGFSVILKGPAYVSHLVLYLNNATPENVYRYITIQANDLETKIPRTIAFVRGNRRRFIVVHFPETIYTDSLKVLPGKTRARLDSMTEIEVYGPVGGPEMLAGRRLADDPLATLMYMGNPAHVPAALPDDFTGEYKEVPIRDINNPPVYGAGITILDGVMTFSLAVGTIQGLPLDGARLQRAERAWRPGSVTPLTTPARYASRLLVGSADYTMHAIADNGTRIWKFKTGGRIYSSPTPYENEVYFGSDDGRLYKVDVDSGILIWEFKTGDRVRSSPAVDGKCVYAASWDGFLYAVDLVSGVMAWKAPVARFTRSSPAVRDGRVYIGDEEGAVHCLNASNGQPLWKAAIGGRISSCPVVTPDGVFALADEGTGAFIGHDGVVRWKRDLLQSMRSEGDSPPHVTGQPFATKTQVCVTTSRGMIMLSRQSGERDARFVPASPGGNCVSAVPWGKALCLVMSHARFDGRLDKFIIEYGCGARLWEPKSGAKQ